MTVTPQHIFADLPRPHTGEVFEQLLQCRNVRIERIVSSAAPDPTTYDQPQDEWVLLLEGSATLELAGQSIALCAGNHLFIPAHTPHRVTATSAAPQCVWLAVHIDPDA